MVDTTVNAISDPLEKYWNGFVDYVPQLVGGLLILVIGLIIASIISAIAGKLLDLVEENGQVQRFLAHWNLQVNLSKFVSRFVWWAVFLVFVSAAVDVLDIPVLSESVSMLVGYLPQLFAAAVIATVVVIGAGVVRGLVRSALDGVGFRQSRGIATAAYVALLVFGLTAAAAQLGIDTTLITANLTVIVAGVVFALALAFGLGGREAAGRIVNGWYEESKTARPKVVQAAKRRK